MTGIKKYTKNGDLIITESVLATLEYARYEYKISKGIGFVFTLNELAEALNLTNSQVSGALSSFKKQGIVKNIRRSVWEF